MATFPPTQQPIGWKISSSFYHTKKQLRGLCVGGHTIILTFGSFRTYSGFRTDSKILQMYPGLYINPTAILYYRKKLFESNTAFTPVVVRDSRIIGTWLTCQCRMVKILVTSAHRCLCYMVRLCLYTNSEQRYPQPISALHFRSSKKIVKRNSRGANRSALVFSVGQCVVCRTVGRTEANEILEQKIYRTKNWKIGEKYPKTYNRPFQRRKWHVRGLIIGIIFEIRFCPIFFIKIY